MNKQIQKLINYIWGKYTVEGLQKHLLDIRLKQKIKYKFEVLKLIEQLKSNNWHKVGTIRIPDKEIWLFETVDQSIEVHIHPEGDLLRVYRQVNDMNVDSLIRRLTAPNYHLNTAKNILNEQIRLMNAPDSDTELSQDEMSHAVRRAMAALMAMENQ